MAATDIVQSRVMKDSKLYSALAFAGAIPFLACALLPLVGIEAIEPLGRLDALASAYGLAIVSFLAGIHWATALYQVHALRLNLFVSSNVVLLFVWLVYVLAPVAWQLASEVLALAAMLLIDRQLQRQDIISRRYLRVRVAATALAGGSLIVLLIIG